MYVDPSGNDYTFAGVEVAMAGRSELDSATSMYYLGILKELTLTLKVAMETYQTGIIATIGAVATLACLEEADVSLFAINDEFHQTIIENIPAPGIIIETFPAYDETGIRIWVTPISDQKALRDLAKESAKRAKQGKTISKEEADILDEWANEYKVPQHHQAYIGSGEHFPGGNYADHTHIYNIHVPFGSGGN